MAGDKHPWRDIYAWSDWNIIHGSCARFIPSQQGRLAKLLAVRHRSPDRMLQNLQQLMQAYHQIEKDDVTKFAQRQNQLGKIASAAKAYLRAIGGAKVVVKAIAGKQLNGRIDPWVASLERRALKKQAYLATLEDWVIHAKRKYKDPLQLIIFLSAVDSDNQRGGHNEFLHATPYATMEKADPYHRNILFFVDTVGTNVDVYHHNPMAEALRDYLDEMLVGPIHYGRNANATFYEWLEYHPICTGTPGVTPGYDPNHKLGVRKVIYTPTLYPISVKLGRLWYNPYNTNWPRTLKTSVFPASAKGPNGGAAFVWDKTGDLWFHEHGNDFNHTSFRGGHKVRASGMMLVEAGKVKEMTNESGHYAPNAIQFYYLAAWLEQKGCLDKNATVTIAHSTQLFGSTLHGSYTATVYSAWFLSKLGPPIVPN